MSDLEKLKNYFETNKDKALQDYYAFLEFQSISSEAAYKDQVLACAEWVVNYLKNLHFDVELWPTTGHPVIFASNMQAGPDQPTLLIYNHYDVQPVDPLPLWNSPPFEPKFREGQVFARGAQDNKGQCFYVLLALKSVMHLYGKLPINVKLCIEGEEECGSAGLSHILKNKQQELQADYLAVVDLGMRHPDQPAITLGIRGLVTMDVEITGTKTDLHSGSHGGIAFNPLHALVEVLAATRDRNGKVVIPGFYDDILPMHDTEKTRISWNFDPAAYAAEFGAKPTGGERDKPPLERNWVRPTLEINGISGGYTGSGFKTVIPAKASAKVSCRLVPGQDPHKIGHLVAGFLEAQAPEGTEAVVSVHEGGGKAVRANMNSPAVIAFAQAYSEVFNKPCEFVYEGASIPIVTELAKTSHSEVVLVGMGLLSDCIHAPNEHFGVDRLEKGFLSIARVLQLLHK
jgi:acetylornithine deacetylase/succinyl-diaminopimelate desuccinylase-like protein